MELEGEPLDLKRIEILVRGVPKVVNALHCGFVQERFYLKFQRPDFENGSFSQEEWMKMMDIIIEDVNWLLMLPYHRFWSTMIYDAEVITFLDTILANIPRYYDIEEYSTRDEVQSLLDVLYDKTFKVYLRMSTYKESKTCHITKEAFGQMIYDNYLFDIPKMMDLCAIYGKSNILCKMIQSIFDKQALYFKDLERVVTAYMQIFVDIQESMGITLSEHSSEPQKLDAKKKLCKLSSMSSEDFKKLIVKVTDCCITLDNFFQVFKSASITLTLQSSLVIMSYFYTNVFPLLKKELKTKLKHDDDLVKKLQKRISQSKVSLVEAFRSMVYCACILPLKKSEGKSQFPTEKEMMCIEEYINIIHSILSEKDFICDYQKKYPFEEDLELFKQNHYCPDTAQISFILNTLYSLYGKSIPNKFLEMLPSSEATEGTSGLQSGKMADVEGACAQPRMEGVELESLIVNIKDLFTDYGEGFIEECLHYYNYQMDTVINAILEDVLPAPLAKLDRKMKKALSSSNTAAKRGELSFTNLFFDEVDKITRRPSPPPLDTKRNRNDSLSQETKKEIIERYGMMDDRYLYDDEYDDTYDSLPMAANDTLDTEEFVTPRVLQKPQKKIYQFVDEEEDSTQNELSGKKPDNFVRNPAEVRAEREAHYQNSRRPQNVRGEAKGHGQTKEVQKDRKNKEAHKSKVGNHNRKGGHAYKQRGGMF